MCNTTTLELTGKQKEPTCSKKSSHSLVVISLGVSFVAFQLLREAVALFQAQTQSPLRTLGLGLAFFSLLPLGINLLFRFRARLSSHFTTIALSLIMPCVAYLLFRGAMAVLGGEVKGAIRMVCAGFAPLSLLPLVGVALFRLRSRLHFGLKLRQQPDSDSALDAKLEARMSIFQSERNSRIGVIQ